MKVKFHVLKHGTKLPTFNNTRVIELHANIGGMGVVLSRGETKRISTGISAEIPNGCVLQIVGRDGFSAAGIICPTRTLDHTYKGELDVILYNGSSGPWQVGNGDRIGALILVRAEGIEADIVPFKA